MVVALARDHVPDASPWSCNVAAAAWYQMKVAMENSLPGCRPCVDPDVKPLNRCVLGQHQFPNATHQGIAGQQLVMGEAKVVDDVASGNHDGMKRRDRESIAECIRKLIIDNRPLRWHGAEKAAFHILRHGQLLAQEYHFFFATVSKTRKLAHSVVGRLSHWT